MAYALPLFKKEDPFLSNSYRPVSFLSCIIRVMQRIISKQIYNFYYKKQSVYKYHAGFSHGHCRFFQFLGTYHSVVKTLTLRMGSIAIYQKPLVDLYGTRGNIFNGYLSCRIKDQLSSSACLHAGVHKGSVLGPLLF